MRLARKLASLCASGVSGVEGIGLADALFIAQGHDTWATLVVPDTRWKAHVEAAAGPWQPITPPPGKAAAAEIGEGL